MEMDNYLSDLNRDVLTEKKIHVKKYVYVKRAIDIILSIGAIALLSPLFLLCSLMILITDGAPIILRQQRVGQFEELFTCYKFRTMDRRTPAYVPTEELKDSSQHITPLGRILRRLSLDELPQLFNILKGEMSFIGPRPLIPQEKSIHDDRRCKGIYILKPGLSGYAQVMGRDLLSAKEKAELDHYYLVHISLWLDMKIFFKTFFVILKKKGYREGQEQD